MGNALPSCIDSVALCSVVSLYSCLELFRRSSSIEYPNIPFSLGWFSMDVTFSIFPEFRQWSMDLGEATIEICRIFSNILWVGCRYSIRWIVEHTSHAMWAVLLTACYGEDVWNLCKDANDSISRFFSNRRSF